MLTKLITTLIIATSAINADIITNYINHRYDGTLFHAIAAKNTKIGKYIKVNIILAYREKNKTIMLLEEILLDINGSEIIEKDKKILKYNIVKDSDFKDMK